LQQTKSGAQIRPIGHAALDAIGAKPARARSDDPVFPGDGKAGHLVGLPKVWQRVCKRAKLSNLTLHGLRHWFGSAATELNFSELTIAGMLGHTVKGVTARYATVPDKALLRAATEVSARLQRALAGERGGEVVNLDLRERA
jgi:integrase